MTCSLQQGRRSSPASTCSSTGAAPYRHRRPGEPSRFGRTATTSQEVDGRAAVELLAELGFDVSARGRTDVPMEQAWETALHSAAGDGDLALARLLLSLGADPEVRDARFDSTPLGWAHHFGQQALVELLTPVTRAGRAGSAGQAES